MDRRSTNVKGFVHFGGDVASGVEDGIGVRLGTASTGSTVWIESVSDDTNANLGIRAQGAGTITLGTSSNGVSIPGTLTAPSIVSTVTGALTMKGAFSTTFAWALAALTSGAQGEITLASSNVDINPGDLVGAIALNATSSATGGDDLFVSDIRFSTVATSRVTLVVSNVASTASSTQSGTGRITWIDLT